MRIVLFIALSLVAVAANAADTDVIRTQLTAPILGQRQVLDETIAFIDARVPTLKPFATQAEWTPYARQLREDFLSKIVFRGQAAAWREAPCKVEWLDVIEGLPGYRIKKLRYEALPGFWIPALLYEPTSLGESVPVVLNVNGHEPLGKAAEYEQIRSINLAKRGMLALHPEWLGMGQLTGDGYRHGCLNQIDLCGTSGLAPFYLAMSRALDVLLAHPNADAKRVAVTGLSGGGWQTIYISALDERVTLSNPVAGYTSLRDAIRHGDMGDSEQCVSDLHTVGDLTHLTALRAPRPTLLTYNAADECCFKADHTLDPLRSAARPIYALFGAKDNLRWHVNHVPGTHNYDLDNRLAFYAFADEIFWPQRTASDLAELPFEGELKTADELKVAMPESNLDLNKLARDLAKPLPSAWSPPGDAASAKQKAKKRREQLAGLLHMPSYAATREKVETASDEGLDCTSYELRCGDAWAIPVNEFANSTEKQQSTVVVMADEGRAATMEHIAELLKNRRRVVAVDPLLLGDAQIVGADPQVYFAIAIAGVGDRPCAIQAAQLIALGKLLAEQHGERLELAAWGPRASFAALLASALEPGRFQHVRLHDSLHSLRQVIEENRTIENYPELFPFGLLAEFDLDQLAELAAPTTIERVPTTAGDRANKP